MKVSKEEGVALYLMRVSQIRDKLQELGEVMYDWEKTTIVLNALPNEWRHFVSSIYGKKETIPFNDLWSLCKIEEARLKAQNDVGSSEQIQANVVMARKNEKSRKKNLK